MIASPVETVKRVPPIVWLVGGAVVVGLFVLKSGGGGSSGVSAGTSSSGAGGGGGGDVGELENLAQGFVDLAEEVRQQEAADADWKAGIEAKLATAAPTKVVASGNISKHYGSDIPSAIKSRYSLTSLDKVLAKSGTYYGTAINLSDLKAALRREHISYGSTVDYKDILKLYKKTGVKVTKPTTTTP